MWQPGWEESLGENGYMSMYAESFHCSPETITALLIGYVPAWVLSCFSRVWLFATPGTVAHQAPLSMGSSKHNYWSGLPCPPPGDLPDPGIELASLIFPVLSGEFYTTSTIWEFPVEIRSVKTQRKRTFKIKVSRSVCQYKTYNICIIGIP